MIEGDIFRKIYEQMAHKQIGWDVPSIGIETLNIWGKEGQPAIVTFAQCSPHEIKVAFEREFGSRPVKVRSGDYGSPERYLTDRKERQMTVGALLASMPSPDDLYMANEQASFTFLRMLTGRVLDELGGEELFESPTVWLGTTGAITPLHKDTTDNFAFHVFGKKTWILFSPRDAPLLNLRSVNDRQGSEFCVSSHDLRTPAVLQELISAGAHPLTCQVGRTECLYLPAGWSHFVVTEELTLMINIWQNNLCPARVLR